MPQCWALLHLVHALSNEIVGSESVLWQQVSSHGSHQYTAICFHGLTSEAQEMCFYKILTGINWLYEAQMVPTLRHTSPIDVAQSSFRWSGECDWSTGVSAISKNILKRVRQLILIPVITHTNQMRRISIDITISCLTEQLGNWVALERNEIDNWPFETVVVTWPMNVQTDRKGKWKWNKKCLEQWTHIAAPRGGFQVWCTLTVSVQPAPF